VAAEAMLFQGEYVYMVLGIGVKGPQATRVTGVKGGMLRCDYMAAYRPWSSGCVPTVVAPPRVTRRFLPPPPPPPPLVVGAPPPNLPGG